MHNHNSQTGPEVKQRIEHLARCNGRSMEGEIRALLRMAVGLGPTGAEQLEDERRFKQMQKSHVEAIIGDLVRRANRNGD